MGEVKEAEETDKVVCVYHGSRDKANTLNKKPRPPLLRALQGGAARGSDSMSYMLAS